MVKPPPGSPGPSGHETHVLGTSWGARFVTHQLSAEGVCQAGAIAHPSFMNESDVFKVNGKRTQDFTENGTTPMLIHRRANIPLGA